MALQIVQRAGGRSYRRARRLSGSLVFLSEKLSPSRSLILTNTRRSQLLGHRGLATPAATQTQATTSNATGSEKTTLSFTKDPGASIDLLTHWKGMKSLPFVQPEFGRLVNSPVPGTRRSLIGLGRALMASVARRDNEKIYGLLEKFRAEELMKYSWIQEAVCFYFCNQQKEREADQLFLGLEEQGIRCEDGLISAWLLMKLSLGKVDEVAAKLKHYLSHSYQPPMKVLMVAIPALTKRTHALPNGEERRQLGDELLDLLAKGLDKSQLNRIPVHCVYFEYLWAREFQPAEKLLVKMQEWVPIERRHWNALLRCYNRLALPTDFVTVKSRLEDLGFDFKKENALPALVTHYAEEGHLEEAIYVLKMHPEAKTGEVLSFFREAYARLGEPGLVDEILWEAAALDGKKYSAAGDFLRVIAVHCTDGDWHTAVSLYEKMKRRYGSTGKQSDADMILAAEVEMKAARGEFDAAYKLLAESGWPILVMQQFLSICRRHGQPTWAEMAAESYCKQGRKLDDVMWKYLMILYMRFGQEDKMISLVDKLKDKKLPLNYKTAQFLVRFMSRCGEFDRVLAVIQECKKQGFPLPRGSLNGYVRERIGLHINPAAVASNLAIVENFVSNDLKEAATQRMYELLMQAACFCNDSVKAHKLYEKVESLGPPSRKSLTFLLVQDLLNGDTEAAKRYDHELYALGLRSRNLITKTLCLFTKGHVMHGFERNAADIISYMDMLKLTASKAFLLETELLPFFIMAGREDDAEFIRQYVANANEAKLARRQQQEEWAASGLGQGGCQNSPFDNNLWIDTYTSHNPQ